MADKVIYGQAPERRGPDEYQFLTPSRPSQTPEPLIYDGSRGGDEIEIDEDDERVLDEVWSIDMKPSTVD